MRKIICVLRYYKKIMLDFFQQKPIIELSDDLEFDDYGTDARDYRMEVDLVEHLALEGEEVPRLYNLLSTIWD
jgi:hypothetical protein